MKTIGFFGDSFCASDRMSSWCRILAKKIGRKPVNYGKPGGSIWDSFLEIETRIKEQTLPDTLFFCYTNPYRLYHKTLSLQVGAKPSKKNDEKIHDAANRYYVYIQDKVKEDLTYRYSLQWFDQKVLRPLIPKHEIIQMWSMDPKLISKTKMRIDLTSGLFIDESVCEYAYTHIGAPPNFVFDPSWENHLTEKGNQDFAYYIYDKIKNFLE